MSAADEAALARIAELLYAHAGLRFAPPRDGSLADAVSRAMERAGLRDLGDYALRLATGGASLDELCDEATVGETYFFREPEQFEFLRRHALPELLWRRGERHAMRLWSAGCASGEEAWSLAMLLEQEGLGGRSHVLATDISRAALARALRGVYGRWSLRGEAAARARPWLRAAERERGGPTFAVDERLRRLVAFDYLNLASDAYPAIARGAFSLDVVLCRNVLIYFDRDIVARVVRRLYDSLADGGWLVLASTDPSPLPLAPFHGVMTAGGMFYRRAPGPPSIHDARKTIHLASPRPQSIEPEPIERAPTEPAPIEPIVPLPPIVSPKPSARAAPSPKSVEPAERALAEGRWAEALALVAGVPDSPGAATVRVRALAHRAPPEDALDEAGKAAARHPLEAGLHYLHAALLVEVGRDPEALSAIRRALYLDRSLVVAHLALGAIFRRAGDAASARRAYRNARDLCAALPPDEEVPLAGGARAGRLAESAAALVALLGGEE